LIRESGIPYTIVRPCALTEELAGADLIFDQGDNITVLPSKSSFSPLGKIVFSSQLSCCVQLYLIRKFSTDIQGKISREEVARICVAHAQCGKCKY